MTLPVNPTIRIRFSALDSIWRPATSINRLQNTDVRARVHQRESVVLPNSTCITGSGVVVAIAILGIFVSPAGLKMFGVAAAAPFPQASFGDAAVTCPESPVFAAYVCGATVVLPLVRGLGLLRAFKTEVMHPTTYLLRAQWRILKMVSVGLGGPTAPVHVRIDHVAFAVTRTFANLDSSICSM